MSDALRGLFGTGDIPPRWSCGSWPPELGWLHIVSDLATFAAYAAIPVLLLVFVRKRRDVPFASAFWLFAAFIFSCGTVHLLEAVIFWEPIYGVSGLVKATTATVSVATAIVLLPMLRRAVDMPSIRRVAGRLNAILSSSSDAIFSKAADGTILSWNAGAERMYGYAEDEAVGRHVSMLVPDDRRQELDAILQRVRRGESINGLQTERVRRDGTRLSVSLTVTPLLGEGDRVLGASTIGRDMTAQKSIETRLRDTAEQLVHANRELRRLAVRDPLTDLLNRRGLEATLDHEVEQMRRRGARGAVVLLDCDDFKEVNDRYGHDGGDAVLCEVARRLRGASRACDRLARVGGDEFLALLPDTRLAEAGLIAERMRLAVADTPIDVPGGEVTVTVSCGVERLDRDQTRLEQLLARASASLHRSKRAGKNVVADEAGLVDDDGFTSHGIRVFSQPIVEVASGRAVGRELLTRGPVGSFELPDDFFRACRERRILATTDLECLRLCLGASRTAPAASRVHVNLFPSTLLDGHREAVAARVGAFPRPERLCLELNEAMIVGDPAALLPETRALREASGLRLGIDDVGYGRSSLETLVVLEPDVVKIDRRYVDGSSEDRGRRQQLARLVRVARALDAEIIAEGVEHEPDRRLLAELGVELGQGYFWGPPAPVD